MKQYMEIGSSPIEENCAQVKTEGYYERAEKELNCYKDQLYRHFTETNEHGISFRIKWFPHDFGTYGEVCVFWNDSDEAADKYAYFIEANLPENWDEQSMKELELEVGK